MWLRAVAVFYGLAWGMLERIDHRHLERELGPPCLDGVEVIAMDEFAIQKGHRYATVVVEPYRKRVLWVGRGRGRLDVRPFFELLGAAGRQGASEGSSGRGYPAGRPAAPLVATPWIWGPSTGRSANVTGLKRTAPAFSAPSTLFQAMRR